MRATGLRRLDPPSKLRLDKARGRPRVGQFMPRNSITSYGIAAADERPSSSGAPRSKTIVARQKSVSSKPGTVIRFEAMELP